MNKIKFFSITYISIRLIETLIILISFIMIATFQYGFDLFFIKGAWRDTLLWNLWRAVYYGLPFLILYLLLFNFLKKKLRYKPLLFAILNLLVYVFLSVSARIIFGKNIPLPPEGIAFWVTCIAITVSPIMLGQIPYFKKVMGSI